MKLSANEITVLILATLGCVFGLSIIFMSENKASLYIAVPAGLVGAAATYLGTKKE